MTLFKGVFPVSGSGPDTLPVRNLGAAIGYYTQVLGFQVREREEKRATLQRDAAQIGLVVSNEDPLNASVYFSVEDVDALYDELSAKGIAPTSPRIDAHDGKQYRVIFAQEPYGVCFVFGQPVEASGSQAL